MNGWQPIETAPKDGARVLVWRRNQVLLANWDEDKYATKPRPFWNGLGPWGRSDDRATPPTHWMPLPLPPGAP